MSNMQRLRFVVFVSVACAHSVRAQDNLSKCAQEMTHRPSSRVASDTADACLDLANALISDRGDTALRVAMALDRTPARDLQPRTTSGAAGAGASSQAEAVPAVQPLGVAGGSLAAVGSGGGTDAIAAFTINPAFLLGTTDKLRAAALQRLLDFTVLVPINNLDRNQDGRVDYFGVRARLNIVGPRAASRIHRALAEFVKHVEEADSAASAMEIVLQRTRNFPECVAEYGRQTFNLEAARTACGSGAVDLGPNGETLARFRAALAAARDSADAQYFGLDLRLDQGDATLGATPGASGTALFAGLAFGRRIVSRLPTDPSYGIRVRLGVQHVELDQPPPGVEASTKLALDGALGFDFRYPYEFSPLVLGAAVEFRSGGTATQLADAAFRTNYVQARLSLDIPITAGNSISVAFATPISGHQKATLTINANWQLLLAAAALER